MNGIVGILLDDLILCINHNIEYYENNSHNYIAQTHLSSHYKNEMTRYLTLVFMKICYFTHFLTICHN